MKNQLPKYPDPAPDPANLDYAELVSTQEEKVVPWFAGERSIAVTWISQIYDQFWRNAPSPGKK